MKNLIKNVDEFELATSSGLVLIDFFASWCNPCKRMETTLEEIMTENEIYVFKVDVENKDTEEITKRHKIRSVPTVLVFKDGILKNTSIGFKSKAEIINLINIQ